MAGRQMKGITVLMTDRIIKSFGSVLGLLEATVPGLDLSLYPAEGLRLRCP